MRVEFFKPSEKHRLCAWEGTRGKRTVVPGTVMAAGASIPHDLARYVIEAATGVRARLLGTRRARRDVQEHRPQAHQARTRGDRRTS